MLRPLAALVLCCTLSAQPLAQPLDLDLQLPDIGDPSQQYLGPSEERRLGQTIVRKLADRDLVLDDVQLAEYLNGLGNRLALHASGNTSPFAFFWMRDTTLNAFALPGSFIGANVGLMLATRNESELAGVLAHEIAHVAQHHITRAYADASRMSIPTMAAMLVGAIIAASAKDASGAQLGQAALAGSIAAGAQRQISFTRANEQEADRVGAEILTRAGYDTDALAAFLGRLENLSGSAAQVPEFLRTHPLALNRMSDVQGRTRGSRGKRADPDELGYRYARARIEALASDRPLVALRDVETRLAEREDEATRYGYALLLRRAGRLDEAALQIARLSKTRPDLIALRIEEAELALARGDAARAWRLFEAARKIYPNDYRLAMSYAEALIGQGDPRQAEQVLQGQLRRRPDEPALHALYARAAERSGDQAGTHLAMAEYYFLNGELKAAIDQAELGLRTADATPYQLAQLRSRLNQLRELKTADDARR